MKEDLNTPRPAPSTVHGVVTTQVDGTLEGAGDNGCFDFVERCHGQ